MFHRPPEVQHNKYRGNGANLPLFGPLDDGMDAKMGFGNFYILMRRTGSRHNYSSASFFFVIEIPE